MGEYKIMGKKKSELEFYRLVHKNLSPGLIVKNYGELCQLLKMDSKGGNIKKANLKELERFCEYEKEGHKFIIKKVFESPKEREDKREHYVTLIETILLDFFIRENQPSISITKNKLWETLGMVSSNYPKGERDYFIDFLKQDEEIKSKKWDIYQWHIDKAYLNSRKKLNAITKSALKSLEDRKLIEKIDPVIVAQKGYQKIENLSDEEIEQILACERRALEDLGFDNVNDLFQTALFTNKKNETIRKYFDLRNKYLKEDLEFDFVYRVYKIICNRSYLKKALDKNIKVLQKKQQLNDKIIKYLDNQAQNDFKKNKEDYDSGKTDFKYQDYYVELQKVIITKILKLGEEDIPDFIESVSQKKIFEAGKLIDDELPIK